VDAPEERVEAVSRAAPSPTPPRPGVLRLAAIAVTGIVAGVAAMWVLVGRSTVAPAVTRLVIAPSGAEVIGMLPFTETEIAVSPDGRRVAYVGHDNGRERLYVRDLSELNATMLGGIDAPRAPVFSPDGQWIAFFERSELKKVAVGGGPPVTIAKVTGGQLAATWGSDNTIIFGTSEPVTGLLRVSAGGGTPEMLTTPSAKSPVDHLDPSVLPTGKAVLFTIRTESAEENQIGVLDLTTGAVRTLIARGSSPRYVGSGHIVYGLAGSLWAAAFDMDRLEVRGDPVPVLEGVVTKRTGAVNYSPAGNGTLVYLAGDPERGGGRVLMWVNSQGREEAVVAPQRFYTLLRVSPDGGKLALSIDRDVWLFDVPRGTLDRLTPEESLDMAPVFSPDGRRIAYGRSGGGEAPGLHVRKADFTGTPERLTTGSHFPLSWSADGNRIVYLDTSGRRMNSFGGDLGVVTIDDRVATPLLATPATEDHAALSPDSRWLAVEINETASAEVVVFPFPDVTSGRWRISTDGGRDPTWSRDGRTLYYRRNRTMMAVEVRGATPSAWSRPESRFDVSSFFFTDGPQTFDLAPDGRFLMMKTVVDNTRTAPQLVVVQNWQEELQQRVRSR
jgi:Tol biopolymer transport system component